jgi:hypothetical protein
MQVIYQYRTFAHSAPAPGPRSGAEPRADVSTPYASTTTTIASSSRTDIERTDASPPPPPPAAQNIPIPSGPGPSPTPSAEIKSDSSYRYVEFSSGDPSNPQNWSLAYKNWVVVQLTFLTLSLTFGSSVSSSAAAGAIAEFGGGELGGTATTGIFVVGVGCGAMPFAPLSECEFAQSAQCVALGT